ncbi:GRP family sugar transporter [Staphylococcus aureus]
MVSCSIFSPYNWCSYKFLLSQLLVIVSTLGGIFILGEKKRSSSIYGYLGRYYYYRDSS